MDGLDIPIPYYCIFQNEIQLTCISHHAYVCSTCYIAGEFARMLQRNQPEFEITDKEVLCVEIAGLCHDLGIPINILYRPFSCIHAWR